MPSLLNEKDGPKAPAGAPETYKDFTVPEGFELDPEVSKEAQDIFRKANLSQEQAQELVNFYTKHTKEAFEAPFNAYLDQREQWRNEIKADPVLGGKLDQVRAAIGRTIDSLGDPALINAFRQAMDTTGAGDNPAFIRAFYKLSERLSEGQPVQGGGPAPTGQRPPGAATRPSAAQAIYPHLPSSQTG